eukprot:844127-Pyramimonas_sp.AAC.2
MPVSKPQNPINRVRRGSGGCFCQTIRQTHRVSAGSIGSISGYFGQVKMPKGPQHRLQTANQGVQYIKGVHGLPNDYRLPTTATLKIPRG